jgi:hypothetical protein
LPSRLSNDVGSFYDRLQIGITEKKKLKSDEKTAIRRGSSTFFLIF